MTPRAKQLIEFPFDGADYRARYVVTAGSVEYLREFAMLTDEGWMAIEPSEQLAAEAERAIEVSMDAARDYLRTGC